MLSLRPLRTAVILTALALGSGTIPAQSLADLARKTRAERSKKPPPKKVFTNKDTRNAEGSVSSSRVPLDVQAAARPRNDAPVKRSYTPTPASSGPGSAGRAGTADTSRSGGPTTTSAPRIGGG